VLALSSRTVRLLVLSYAVKTALLAGLWIAVPDWHQRPLAWARDALARLSR